MRTNALVGALFVAASMILPAGAQGRRPWTAEDSVSVTNYVSSQENPGVLDSRAGSPVAPSPDGTRFFFVRRRGEVACDCVVYNLDIYAVASLTLGLGSATGGRPAPLQSITMRSESSEPAISYASWADDDPAVVFVGMDDENRRQVFRLDVVSGALSRLSNGSHQDIATSGGSIPYTARGDEVVYFAEVERRPRDELLRDYPARALTASDWRAVLIPEEDVYVAAFAARARGAARQVGPTILAPAYAPLRAWMSPTGRFAVVLSDIPMSDVPAAWARRGYRTAVPPGALPEHGRSSGLSQFLLVDIESGQYRPLLDAPTGSAIGIALPSPRVVWSHDGRHVLVVNTALPPERGGAQVGIQIVGIDVLTGRRRVVETIAAEPADARVGVSETRIAEPRKGELVTIEHRVRGEPAHRAAYRFGGARRGWRVSASPSDEPPSGEQPPRQSLADGWRVLVRESQNEPPMVVAQRGGEEIVLTAPDTQLSEAAYAPAERFTWRDENGNEWQAGLVLPVNGAGSAPLVIQLSRYSGSLFRPDGSYQSMFAGQLLAAQGFAVLSVDHFHSGSGEVLMTPREAPALVAGLDAAVDELARRGIVDSRRVGIIGFSHTGFLVNYALTHPGRTHFGAAISADAGDPSYLQDLAYSVVAHRAVDGPSYADVNGGQFWQNREAWLAAAPGFNAAQVTAPLMIVINGRHNLPTNVELYAALRMLDRPVEYLLFPEGTHQLIRPRERIAAMTATRDWMAFWLQDYEDPDPAKAGQYARWRALRELRRARR